ncbi:hypothetical protein A6E02_18705 [Aliivibrio fischeri]|nr:hypothetical protein A6E02_18705 [Aliivibrio fischeri]
MNTSRKKQGGFVMLIGLLIVLSLATMAWSTFSVQQQKQRIKADMHSFYNRLLFLKQQLHAYNADQYQSGTSIHSITLFPNKLEELEGAYVHPCPPEENAKGLCYLINQTPWGSLDYETQTVSLPTGEVTYRGRISFTLPDPDDPTLTSESRMMLSMITALPNTYYEETTRLVSVLIDRPDMAFAYDGLVKRSGDDSTLLGDWDVGGDYAITNAKDYTIRNDDGSQQLVSKGLVSITQVEHGDFIDKPQCPTDQEPVLTLNIQTVSIMNEYTLTGSIKPYVLSETNTQWQAGLEIRVRRNSTGTPDLSTKGIMNAFVQCEKRKP